MRVGNSPSFAMLSVDRRARVPLHEQLSDALRRAIVDGTLGARQRLPSTRTLALELGVSRFTVLTAYEGLTDEGYLTGLRGSGTFVSPTLPESMLRSAPAGSNGRASSDAAERAERAAVPVARDEGGLRPFRVSVPALDHFPHALWARL